jgi:HK97 family phage major capsid protein
MAKNIPPELEEKFKQCKEKVMAGGQDEEAAYGICYMSVVEGKSLGDAFRQWGATKVGARNSRRDTERLQTIHDFAVENGAACNKKDIEITDETPVFFGGAVKALDDSGKVGGYLVKFTPEGDLDLTGDHFTSETDYGEADRLPVMYHHGFDAEIGKRRIGVADVKRDDVGLWAETQLYLRDEYEKMVFELAKRGKLGYSSGAAPHAVERTPEGKGYKITQWYIAEASLTPTPAEPRNSVVPIKSLIPSQSDMDVADDNQKQKKELDMEKDELKAMFDEQKTSLEALVTDKATEAAKTAVKDFADSLPEIKASFNNVQVTKDEADKPFASIAEQMKAVKAFTESFGKDTHPRMKYLESVKAPLGMNEGVPSQGGFLLDPTLTDMFIAPIHEMGAFSSRVSRLPVSANSNYGWINGVDETSRATGSRWGGVQGYRRAEAGSVAASKPKFRRINWELKAYEALVYVTEEMLQDVSMTTAIVNKSCIEELQFMANDDILNGDGVGKPLGILNSGALISVSRVATSSVSHADILAMYQRLHPQFRGNSAWFVNSEVEPKLNQLYFDATTSVLSPYVSYGQDGVLRIMGKPVIVTEFNAALGTAGDILLADVSQYLWWEKGGIQSSVNPWIQWLTSEQAFKFTYRADGQSAYYSAITPYKGTSTQSPFVTLLATT